METLTEEKREALRQLLSQDLCIRLGMADGGLFQLEVDMGKVYYAIPGNREEDTPVLDSTTQPATTEAWECLLHTLDHLRKACSDSIQKFNRDMVTKGRS